MNNTHNYWLQSSSGINTITDFVCYEVNNIGRQVPHPPALSRVCYTNLIAGGMLARVEGRYLSMKGTKVGEWVGFLEATKLPRCFSQKFFGINI